MWLARSPLVDEGVVVRPDQVSLGVLVNAVPRDLVDEAVAVCGVRERRSDGKLPAHVITYLNRPGFGGDSSVESQATRLVRSPSSYRASNSAGGLPPQAP